MKYTWNEVYMEGSKMDFIEIIPVKGGNLPSDFMFYKNEEAISVQRYLVFRVGCSFMEIIRKCIVVGIFPNWGTLSYQYGIFHPDFTVNVGLFGPSQLGPACSRHKGIDGVFFNLSD